MHRGRLSGTGNALRFFTGHVAPPPLHNSVLQTLSAPLNFLFILLELKHFLSASSMYTISHLHSNDNELTRDTVY